MVYLDIMSSLASVATLLVTNVRPQTHVTILISMVTKNCVSIDVEMMDPS
jgi:hypothetical protein